ncbi:hypothetical protein ACS0TY_021681 [Phlomoides rotata]
MDLDFDKYCLVDGSPTTVLPAPRCHSKVADRVPSRKPRYVNEIPSVSEDLEINFSHYHSASCRDFQSQRVSQEGNEVLRRGSIYYTSREVSSLHKTDAAVERKKIESLGGTESALPIGIIDSLCISDEDSFLVEENRSSLMSLSEQSTSSVYENQVDFCSYDSMITFDSLTSPVKESNISQEKDSPAKSRFNPVKKMLDPFVKSKSNRSPSSSFSGLSSINRNRTICRSLMNEDKVNHDSVYQCSPAHLHGLFKLGTKHGAPFFHFSVKSLGDVYVAKRWKAENASNWVYTFHSLPRGKRSRKSSMVGQMHVSCYQCTDFKGAAGESKDFMVTEFVLHDIIHSSCSIDVIKASQPLAAAKLHPGLEIAAIVMQAPLEKRESLKFKSGDRKIDDAPPNLLDLFQLGKAKEGSLENWSPGKMHVVIPAGSHSSPVTERHGPSSLLDRWRLGGGCDCGGWDMACPLSVFGNPTVKIAEGQPLIDDQNPTELFVQGRKDDTPAFTVRVIEDGKYAVDFHAQLSSLQAFSICVAMLHAADASTIVGPERSGQMLQSESLRVFAEEEIKTVLDGIAEEEKSKVNKMEEIMPSFVINPPFSPIARV